MELRILRMISGTGQKTSIVRPCGFSILEFMIVMLLAGLIIVMAIPAISTLSNSEMQGEAQAFGSLVTDAYGRSALGSEPYRIVIELDKNQYWLEGIKPAEDDDGSVGISLGQLFGGEQPSEEKEQQENSSKKPNSLLMGPNFSAVGDEAGDKHNLPSDLAFLGAQIDPETELKKEGIAYLYFLPGGETQRAVIVIKKSEDDEDILAIRVSGLTGLVQITPELDTE